MASQIWGCTYSSFFRAILHGSFLVNGAGEICPVPQYGNQSDRRWCPSCSCPICTMRSGDNVPENGALPELLPLVALGRDLGLDVGGHHTNILNGFPEFCGRAVPVCAPPSECVGLVELTRSRSGLSILSSVGVGAPAPTKEGVSLAGNVSLRASSIRRSRRATASWSCSAFIGSEHRP